MAVYRVHFTNNAGEDIYIEVVDYDNAKILIEELRLLKIPAELEQWGTIPE